jgi:hypothetical protein
LFSIKREIKLKKIVLLRLNKETLFEVIQSKDVKVTAETKDFNLISDQKINNYLLEGLLSLETDSQALRMIKLFEC